LFLAGERADPDTLKWAERMLKVPVIDHWWQTETGWCIAGNPVGLGRLPVKYGSACVPMPGYAIDIVDESCRMKARQRDRVDRRQAAAAPGCFPTLWQQDARFKESYLSEFPGYYKTADAGYKDDDGYVYVMSRTDDIINVAGHRLSTGGMEEVLASHPGRRRMRRARHQGRAQGRGALRLHRAQGRRQPPAGEIEKEIVALVREKIGPVAAFKLAITVARLPKTRSGKILRGTIKKIADGEPWTMPATIDDLRSWMRSGAR
jgi:propionyl-CoA synthetase